MIVPYLQIYLVTQEDSVLRFLMPSEQELPDFVNRLIAALADPIVDSATEEQRLGNAISLARMWIEAYPLQLDHVPTAPRDPSDLYSVIEWLSDFVREKPVWDERRFSYRGSIITDLTKHRLTAINLIPILHEFQTMGWPKRAYIPRTVNIRNARRTLRRMKSKLKITLSESDRTMTWEPPDFPSCQ